jgi:hypothetical protein
MLISKVEVYEDSKWVLGDEEMIKDSKEAQFFKEKNFWHPTKTRIVLSPWNVCTNDQGSDLDLLFHVFNRVGSSDIRNKIRRTFADRIKYHTVNVVFVLGRSVDPLVNLKVVDENRKFGDIIQGDFIDAYRNCSFKLLILWRWTIHNCPNARYVGKMDDDMFFDTKKLLDFMENKTLFNPPKRSFSGEIFLNQSVIRVINSRHGVPYEEWSESTYKTYANGPVYVSKVLNLVYFLRSAANLY